MAKIYRVGTRASPLALRQAQEVLAALKKSRADLQAELVGIETYGDKDKATPISEVEGSDFFTREIDDALLKGEVDFAVHSAKDLPAQLREGLVVAAVTKSIDPYDALVSRSGLKLDGLAGGAKIATSSLRRKSQLKKYRGDFQVVDIRGNIQERLRLLDEGGVDAIVIAAAGLLRLGLEQRITQRIPFSILRPHPLQGCLAITARSPGREIKEILSKLREDRGWRV